MRHDPGAGANPGRYLAALVVEELHRHGLGLVVACPGGRNQPLLATLAARDDLDCRRVVDERAAGHLALGWLRGQLAAGEPPRLAVVITTSGTAPLLLAPALAEAHESGLPLVLVSADRPHELHGVGANQTIDQVTPLAPLTRVRFTLPCHAGGAAPRDVLSAVAEAARVAHGPPAGPVQLNLQFREPLVPDPEPLPDRWTADAAAWAERSAPFATAPTVRCVPDEALVQLRDEVGTARRPLFWLANLATTADRGAADALARQSTAPWLADAGSGVRLRPASDRRLDQAGFYGDLLRDCDLVVQLGQRPVSLTTALALTGARRWVVSDHPGRQDPRRQGGVHLRLGPAELRHALGDRPLLARPDRDWIERLTAAQAEWNARLVASIDRGDTLSEAWTVREVVRRLGPDHGLMLGNSLPVRHLDTLTCPDAPGPVVTTNRGTSGIEGQVAQAIGVSRGLGRPTVAILGDVTTQHDLGSLAILADEAPPLMILVLQNSGGGIFRRLQASRHPQLLDPWLTAHHPVDLCAVARAHGVFARRVRHRGGLANALTDFVRHPEST
ncbi:2-succinyl-5-enolpyruvyl-6-hydroxy-3-cyclohexene-1-carboxylic-acid synthase, partial [bacterium]|nr:2-succinyl-5-enolpyruvyl-6-hydroxy-3-cyclohexene-1-carboxylic-acid synthase [bacterium]